MSPVAKFLHLSPSAAAAKLLEWYEPHRAHPAFRAVAVKLLTDYATGATFTAHDLGWGVSSVLLKAERLGLDAVVGCVPGTSRRIYRRVK